MYRLRLLRGGRRNHFSKGVGSALGSSRRSRRKQRAHDERQHDVA
jgi:hypothetical protein